MSGSTSFRTLACGVVLTSVACGGGTRATGARPATARDVAVASAHAQPVAVPRAVTKVGAASARDVAASWLKALAERDVERLGRLSRFPLQLRDTGSEGRCESERSAPSADALAGSVACLVNDDLLVQTLGQEPAPRVVALARERLPEWARSWAAGVGPDAEAFTAFVERPDAVFELVMFATSGGVEAFFKHGTDAVAQVAVAKRWLEALRVRDADALATHTRYPFELRDTETSGPCGKPRTVRDAAALRAALQCLMSDASLHGALEESRDSVVRASPSTDEVPEWVQPFLRMHTHAGLWPVTVILAKEACCEYDFTLLVDATGVHALFKTGASMMDDEHDE